MRDNHVEADVLGLGSPGWGRVPVEARLGVVGVDRATDGERAMMAPRQPPLSYLTGSVLV